MRGTSAIARIAELALVGSMILSACVGPAGGVSRFGDDRSQDQAERTRSLVGPAGTTDTSYDQVERARGGIFAPAPSTAPSTGRRHPLD
jgi:hypothetical protein